MLFSLLVAVLPSWVQGSGVGFWFLVFSTFLSSWFVVLCFGFLSLFMVWCMLRFSFYWQLLMLFFLISGGVVPKLWGPIIWVGRALRALRSYERACSLASGLIAIDLRSSSMLLSGSDDITISYHCDLVHPKGFVEIAFLGLGFSSPCFFWTIWGFFRVSISLFTLWLTNQL